MEYASKIDATAADTYRYLNFDKMGEYVEKADKIIIQTPAKCGVFMGIFTC